MTDTIQRDALATGAFDDILSPAGGKTPPDRFDGWVREGTVPGRRGDNFEVFSLKGYKRHGGVNIPGPYSRLLRGTKVRVHVAPAGDATTASSIDEFRPHNVDGGEHIASRVPDDVSSIARDPHDSPELSDNGPALNSEVPDQPAATPRSPRAPLEASLMAAALAMNRGYRAIWLVLSLLAMGWTWLSGLSLLAGIGIPRGVAVLGLVAMVGLIVTTFVAGAPRREKR